MRSAARVKDLATPGKPDHIRPKRGDVWTNENIGEWTRAGAPLSGRGPDEPMCIYPYGSGALPRFNTGIGSLFQYTGNGNLHDVVLLSIDWDPHTYTGNNGSPSLAIVTGPADRILIEGCRANRGRWGVRLAPFGRDRIRDVVIRRCTLLDGRTSDVGGGSAIDVRYTDGLIVEECHIDAWGTTTSHHGISADWSSTEVGARKNVISRCRGTGIRLPCGGVFDQNVLLQLGRMVEFGGQSSEGIPGGVPVVMLGNLLIEGRNYFTGGNPAAGIAAVGYNLSSATIADNIITQNTGTNPFGFVLDANQGAQQGAAVLHNVTLLRNKMFKWGGQRSLWINAQNFVGQPLNLANMRIESCDLQEPDLTTGYLGYIAHNSAETLAQIAELNCRLFRGGSDNAFHIVNLGDRTLAQWKSALGDTTSAATDCRSIWPTEALTIGDYHGSVGGTATTQGFIDACRLQTRDAWDVDLTAAEVLSDFVAAFAG